MTSISYYRRIGRQPATLSRPHRPIIPGRRDGLQARPPRPNQSPAPFPGTHRRSSIVIRHSLKPASSPLPLIPSPSREGTGAGFYRRRQSAAPIVRRPIVQVPTTTNQPPPVPVVGTAFRPVRPARNNRRRHSPAPIVHRPSSIVKASVTTPPLDPLPVPGGGGCWGLSPSPFSGTHGPSVIGPHPSPETQHHPSSLSCPRD